MATCEVCEAAETETEAVLFPTAAVTLFAMLEAHADDPEAWPSVWICSACEPATRPVFAKLAALPPVIVCLVTCEALRELCRAARDRGR